MPHFSIDDKTTQFFKVYLGNKWGSMHRRDSKPHGVPFLFYETETIKYHQSNINKPTINSNQKKVSE